MDYFSLFSISTIFFLLLSLSLFTFRRIKPWCRCDICNTLLKSTWTSDFYNLSDWYAHLLQKSPTSTIHIHVLNNIVTANPKNVEYILKTNFNNYPKGKPFSTLLGDLLGRGIFNVDGDLWKFQRKMASLQLGSSSVKSFAFETVTSEIESRLIPVLYSFSNQKDRILDLQDVFRRFSLDVICIFSFGFDPDFLNVSLPVSQLALAFDLASKLSAERGLATSPFVWKMKRFFGLGSENQLNQAVGFVNVLAQQMITNKRDTGFSTHKDLLSCFMAAIDDDKFLRDIVVSFLLAGLDTIASGLTSFFWLLAQNQEVIEAIRMESNQIMGSTKKVATYEQLHKMHYLQAAIYEGLRLYPPVQFDSKFCEKDDVLPDGHFVKKGTRVTYHPYAMGRMKSIWGDDCLEFKPERWLQDGVFRPANPFEFAVFQAGARVCLGKDMALMEMKSVALAVVREFDVQTALPLGHTPRFMPGLTAAMKGGLPVFVQRRN